MTSDGREDARPDDTWLVAAQMADGASLFQLLGHLVYFEIRVVFLKAPLDFFLKYS